MPDPNEAYNTTDREDAGARGDDRDYEYNEGVYPGHSVDEATETVQAIEQMSEPLETDEDLDLLLSVIGDARIVMLGEATHGTHEFYAWRARLTELLVRELGFDFVAVEGDWPDCEAVNRYVKGDPRAATGAREALQTFERWPTWMWANRDVETFTERLREINTTERRDRPVGFYGLDVYSLWESLESVVNYLQEQKPDAVPAAMRAISCFEPFEEDEQAYARQTLLVPEDCEDEVVDLLTAIRRDHAPRPTSGEEAFSAEQNGLVAVGAERYYRTMARGGGASWNLRDTHMMDTLDRLLDFHGPQSRAVVWAHNTHVGDARATTMARQGLVNIGQLARERHGSNQVHLLGFGTYEGSVIAGRGWGAPMERMTVPPAAPNSVEDLLHRGDPRDKLLLFQDPEEWGDLLGERDHRAIGVVYDPRAEARGNYVATVLPERYDAFLFVDRSRALEPLAGIAPSGEAPPETYPSGY